LTKTIIIKMSISEKIKFRVSFGIIILFTCSLFAQIRNDSLKEIKGKVTYLNVALPKANVIVNNNEQGTETDMKGDYLIKAKAGDIIKYSYIGFETISILIEDVTSVLNIEMIVKTKKLDEIVLKSTKKDNDFNKPKQKFSTSKGEINPEAAGYSVAYINGNKIDLIYPTLAEALDGKVAGVRRNPSTGKLSIRGSGSALWDVDGVIFDDEPPLNLNEIEKIYILKSLAATNRYGSIGSGGVVVVITKLGNFTNNTQQIKNVSEQYTNKKRYNNDAFSISEKAMWKSNETAVLEEFNNKQKALDYYEKKKKNLTENYSLAIKIARLFNDFYSDRSVSIQILNEILSKHPNNPEIVKAIGYQMDYLRAKTEAKNIYEKVFKLRPFYAQSYRDLANAYKNNNNFKRAWRMYISYMLQQKDHSNQKVNELIFNEMEWLYYNRKNQAGIRESFIPNTTINNFRRDVRFVFEWNTSEAEFNLEFVNPNKQSYVFEHRLISNKNLIENEKRMGFSSKDFFINDLGVGEWLVNITYFGNKKTEPTFFKVTKYSNWGSPNQTQNIYVYSFEEERDKFQLFKLSN